MKRFVLLQIHVVGSRSVVNVCGCKVWCVWWDLYSSVTGERVDFIILVQTRRWGASRFGHKVGILVGAPRQCVHAASSNSSADRTACKCIQHACYMFLKSFVDYIYTNPQSLNVLVCPTAHRRCPTLLRMHCSKTALSPTPQRKVCERNCNGERLQPCTFQCKLWNSARK